MSMHPLQKLYREERLHPFTVTINPTYRRFYCAKHADGMGYLYADHCPDCRLVPDGWAAWGSNGHQQGSGPDRASLLHFLKYHAYRSWPAEKTYGPGHYLRMVFRTGGRIVYLG